MPATPGSTVIGRRINVKFATFDVASSAEKYVTVMKAKIVTSDDVEKLLSTDKLE